MPELFRDAAAFRSPGEWLTFIEGREPPGIYHRIGRLPTGTTLVSAMDPQRPASDMRFGTDPAFLDLYLAGLPLLFPPPGMPAAQLPVMLAIAERLTGLAFVPVWLDEPHVIMTLLSVGGDGRGARR